MEKGRKKTKEKEREEKEWAKEDGMKSKEIENILND